MSNSSLGNLLSLFLRSLPAQDFHKSEGYTTTANAPMKYFEISHRGNVKDSLVATKEAQNVVGNKDNKFRTLVMLHGYGLGLGFFFNNYEHLLRGHNPNHDPRDNAKVFDRIVALDWPGMGSSKRSISIPRRHLTHDLTSSCSSKPSSDANEESKSNCRICCSDGGPEEKTINFMIDSLQEWRMQDEKMLSDIALGTVTHDGIPDGKINDKTEFEYIIAGHSLGGYLSTNYALKYPESLSGLVLISPIGLEQQPEKQISFIRAFPLMVSSFGIKTALIFTLVRFLWSINITLNSVVNTFQFLNMKDRVYSWVRGFVLRRFQHSSWSDEEVDAIANYLYDMWSSSSCGEQVLNSLLVPSIFLRDVPPPPPPSVEQSEEASKNKGRRSWKNSPMGIGIYARKDLHEHMAKLKVPTLLMYGDDDWLHYEKVPSDVEYWRQRGHANLEYQVIAKAGHHLYIDNPHDFNEAILEWMKREDSI